MEAWLIAIVALGALLIVGTAGIRARRQVAALERAGDVAPGPTPSSRSPSSGNGRPASKTLRPPRPPTGRPWSRRSGSGVIGVDERLRIVTANAAAHGLHASAHPARWSAGR